MKRPMQWLAWAGLWVVGGLGGGGLQAQDVPYDFHVHFDDFGVGEAVTRIDPMAVAIPGGAIVQSGLPTLSPKNFLARKELASHPAGTDPDPMVLVFDVPHSVVAFAVGDNGGKSRQVLVRAYAGADLFKPMAQAQVTLPAQAGATVPVRLCRILERDIERVEILAADGAVELIDGLEVSRYPTTTSRITFDDQPLGTVIVDQYPGVRFPDGPEIRGTGLFGVPVRSGDQGLRQRPAGELDSRPLVMNFDPPQGAVRVHVGYPFGENDGGPLRVVFRAYGGEPKASFLAGEHEVSLDPGTPIRIPLEICRNERDIHRVEVWFDRKIAGYEVIDDLEFGPRAPRVTPTDTEAPWVVIETPADGAVVPQPSPRPEHQTTTVSVTGRIGDNQSVASARLEVIPGNGSAPFVDPGFRTALTGATSPYRFNVPVLLTYGTNIIRISAIDGAGNAATNEVAVAYVGPRPVRAISAAPTLAYPQITFREASATGGFLGAPDPIVSLTTENLHEHTRIYLVPAVAAVIPPSAPDLIEAEVLSRNADGTGARVRVPAAAFTRPGRYVWLIWDLWSRPGGTPWTRAGDIEVRQWPFPALWSMGFGNRDETNGIAEFEGVFGTDIEPGFLETTSDLGGCSRGTSAVSYFLDTFDPGMNGAPGSCYGYAAMTQLLAAGWLEANRFDPAVRYPTGFRATGTMEFNGTGCTLRTPRSLWATIQTFYGVQYSYEDLYDWDDQLDLDGNRWIGDPLGLAARIRGAELDYTIAVVPGGMAAGHVVAPYRVEDRDANTVRIWVIDSNAPYDVAQPEEALVNQIALHRFIDIDRRNNTYRFSVDASTNAAAEYQGGMRVFSGQGIATTRVGLFRSRRSIPGLSAWFRQVFSVMGDADPLVQVEGRGEFGWKADGSSVSTLSGITPFFGSGFAGDVVRQPLILVPTNDTRVRVVAQARGPNYRFRAAAGGVTLGLHRRDAAPGTGDEFEVVNEGGIERGYRLTARSKALAFEPVAIATDGKTFETAAEWVGLKLDADDSIAIGMLPGGRGVSLRNDTFHELHFGVVLRAAGTGVKDAVRRLYGPFDLEPGATLQLDLSDTVGDFVLHASVDADGDGKADRERKVEGAIVDLLKGAAGDCNQNGLVDAYDILRGDAVDTDGNGVPDSCGNQGGGGTGTEPCPPNGLRQVKLDVLPDGPAPFKLDAITELGRAAQMLGGQLGTMLPEGATNDPEGLELRFRCPRGFVRLDLRRPFNGTGPKAGGAISATVRAYASLDATKPTATLTRVLVGGTTPDWFEVVSPLDEDIARVEIVYSGDGSETLAGLEHGTYVNPVVTKVDFDELAPGTRVDFQYPGVRFLDSQAITTSGFLGVTTASGSQALRRVADGQLDLPAMRFRLSPPQLGVRVKVGFPTVEDTRAPLTIIARAYDLKGRLLGSETNRLRSQSPIRTPMMLTAVNDQRIASFSVEYLPEVSGGAYRHPGFEVIDDLEFGPFPPGAANDRTAPAITLTSPTPDPVVVSEPTATTRNVSIVGQIREPNGIAELRAEIVDPSTGAREELVAFESSLGGISPNYHFIQSITLPLGQRELRIFATDYVGNTGSNIVNLATLPFPPVVVSHVPDAMSLSYPIRDSVFAGSESGLWIQDFENAFGSTSLRDLGLFDGLRMIEPTPLRMTGENFHNNLRLFLAPTNAVVGADPARWNRGAFVPVGFSVTTPGRTNLSVLVPRELASQLGSRWRWVIQDPVVRPGAVEWTVGGDLRMLPEITRLYGLPFVNQDDTVGLGMFDTVFGGTVYISNPICDFRDPVALVTYLVFKIWMDNTRGSCVGFSATSQLMRNELLDPARFVPGVRYPAGLYPRDLRMGQFPLPEVHDNPTCGPRTPANLWAFIRGMQGVQTSSEFVAAWSSQVYSDGGFSIGGRPNRVIEMIRAHPEQFVLTMVPSVGSGHAVAPYEVVDVSPRICRIRVYDPNHPSHRVGEATWDYRASAASQYIEVDRVANTYRFHLGSRLGWDEAGGGTVWSGNGLYALPLRLWTGPRHWLLSLSGVTQLTGLPFLFGTAGAAVPHVTSGTNEWGWGADGKFVDRFPGIAVPPLVGVAGQSHSNALVMFTQPPGPLTVRMHSQGGDYHLATAGGGLVWDLHVRDSVAGDDDRIEPRREAGVLTGFDFTPERATTGFLPVVGMAHDETNRLVLRWSGLDLPAGGRVGLDADASRGESRIRNHTGRTLRPRVLVEGASPLAGNHVFELPAFEVPVGGNVSIRSVEGSESGRFEVATDRDGDGRIDVRVMVTALRLAVPGENGIADRNGNGTADAIDIAMGDATDWNGNAIPDDVEGVVPAPVLEVVGVDAATGRVHLRVRSGTSGVVKVERSVNLLRWEPIGEGQPVDGVVELFDAPSSEAGFYRATVGE